MQKTNELREYLKNYPDTTVQEAEAKFNLSRTSFYNVRKELGLKGVIKNKRTPKSPNEKPKATTMEIGLTVPEGGVVIKLQNGYVIGTLNITSTGLRFMKPNAKKNPSHELSWNNVVVLQEFETR